MKLNRGKVARCSGLQFTFVFALSATSLFPLPLFGQHLVSGYANYDSLFNNTVTYSTCFRQIASFLPRTGCPNLIEAQHIIGDSYTSDHTLGSKCLNGFYNEKQDA
jgi:hypothetical protein